MMYTTTKDGVTEYHMNTYTYEPKSYTTGADLLAADRRAAEDIAQLTHYITALKQYRKSLAERMGKMTFRPVCRYKSGTDEQERNGGNENEKRNELL